MIKINKKRIYKIVAGGLAIGLVTVLLGPKRSIAEGSLWEETVLKQAKKMSRIRTFNRFQKYCFIAETAAIAGSLICTYGAYYITNRRIKTYLYSTNAILYGTAGYLSYVTELKEKNLIE